MSMYFIAIMYPITIANICINGFQKNNFSNIQVKANRG